MHMKKIALSSFSNNWPNRIEIVLRISVLVLLITMLIKLMLLPSLTLLLSLAVMTILASAVSGILRELRRWRS